MRSDRAAPARELRELTISCFQPARVLACTRTVSRFVEDKAGNAPSSFWDGIRSLQHTDINLRPSTDAPQLAWYEGTGDPFANALSNLMGNVDIPDSASYSNAERRTIEAAYSRALERFSAVLPTTYIAFIEAIAFVVLARRPGYSGGTVSSRIGLIWLAPEQSWSNDEWVENLVHEFVHNCLFLEDMMDTIFLAGGSRLQEQDALATSAIRQVKRGYDKAYHSAFVSFSIIELHRLLGNTQKVKQLLDPLLVCVADLSANLRFITQHGQDLLVELAEQVLEVKRQVSAGEAHE